MGKYVTVPHAVCFVLGGLLFLALDKRGYIPASVKF